jgi:hypothetical protein
MPGDRSGELPYDPPLECDQVGGDIGIGQLGHGTDHASVLKILSSVPTYRGLP